MDSLDYRDLISRAPFGYAYHQIVTDQEGNPCDYIFLEVNPTFERLTGLSKSDLIGKQVSEVIPAVMHDEFDWIQFYGDVALNEKEREVEQYSTALNRWYRILAYSPKKGRFATIFTDITIEKEETYNLEGFNAVNLDLMCITDKAGTFHKINQAWNFVFGYEFEDLKNIKYFDLVHPDDIEKSHKEVEKLRKDGEVLNFVNRFLCKDGSYKHIEWRAKKKDNLIFSAARDVSERVAADDLIKEREANFSAFFEAIDDIIFICNLEGKVLYVNKSSCEKLMYSKDELLEKNILEVHHNEYEKEIHCYLNEIFTGNRKTCPVPLQRKDGQRIEVDTHVWIGKWNGRDSLFCLSKDLTAEMESLQKFNKMFDNNPALIAVCEFPSMKFLEINAAFLEKTKFSKDEVVGKTPLELNIFTEDSEHMDFFLSIGKKGLIQNVELKIRTKTERILDGLFSGTLFESKGKKYFMTVMTDITRLKEVERELARSREQYMLAVTGSNDGIWDWDLKTNKMFISDRWKEMLGYKDSEIANSYDSFSLLMHEDDRQRVFSYLDRYLKGEITEYKIEFRMMHKDGYPRWILSKGQAFRDSEGIPYRMAGFHSDITDSKLTEDALISQTALQTILMDISSKYININFSEIDSSINESLRQLASFVGADRAYVFDYDFKRNICKNSYEWCAEGIDPQIDQLQNVPTEAIHWWVETHIKGDSLYIDDVYALEENDPVRHILEPQGIKSIITIPLMESENCIGFVGFDFVKTDRPYSDNEEILLRVFAEMLVNVKHRADLERKLIEEKSRAEIASKAKSEFLANMSHEIRTPLNGVIGFTELLKNSPLSAVQQQYVENANISAHSLLGIINDILDFSKIEAGKLDLEMIMTDIVELVEQSSDIIKFQSSKKSLELLLNIDPSMPRFALVDPIRLKQILVNLLSNAVKFTESGEIEIKIAYQNINDKVGSFTFSVRDTGIGISEDQRNKLFKAFSQADSSTTRKFGGTGLGLVISNLLAEKMGSRIELESEQGTGSTFYFTLYTRFEDGDKLDANSLDGIKRVLVVDDNDNNRMILEHTLKNWGIEFTGCDNGFSSLQMIEKSKMFDVAIIDYHMPYLNGLDTIRMIRETLKIGPEKLPIILLHSSSDDIAIHEECKRLKVRFNLIKPVKSQELLHYIRNIRNVEDTEFKGNELKETKQQALAENLKSTIMIVEDVELNMILARTIVKQLVPNAVILEAKNGRIGCELAEKHNISLILMDVQMPEMNGLEATERIRQMDKEKGIHTPILALSAGVVKGEKEKCFEAGMDDFLAKPISIDELRKAFERYLKREESTEEIITTEDDPKSHFDRDALLSRIDNNTTILNQILDTAKGDIQKDVDDLVISIKEKDFDKIKSQGHALKGVALTLSFNKLGELAKEIEIAAKEGSDKIDSLVDDLTAEWNYIKTII